MAYKCNVVTDHKQTRFRTFLPQYYVSQIRASPDPDRNHTKVSPTLHAKVRELSKQEPLRPQLLIWVSQPPSGTDTW